MFQLNHSSVAPADGRVHPLLTFARWPLILSQLAATPTGQEVPQRVFTDSLSRLCSIMTTGGISNWQSLHIRLEKASRQLAGSQYPSWKNLQEVPRLGLSVEVLLYLLSLSFKANAVSYPFTDGPPCGIMGYSNRFAVVFCIYFSRRVGCQ